MNSYRKSGFVFIEKREPPQPKVISHPAALSNISRTRRSESIDTVKRLRKIAQSKPEYQKKEEEEEDEEVKLVEEEKNEDKEEEVTTPRNRSSAFVSPNTRVPRKKRKLTAGNYLQKKDEFQNNNWTSVTSLYAHQSGVFSNISISFPNWNELPKGLDPKFNNEEERSSEVLYIDSIGFEAEVRGWINKMDNVTIKEIQENLINPSEFTCFSTKSKTKKISLSLDNKKRELIFVSHRSNKEKRISLSQITEIRVGPKTKGFETYRNEVIKESNTFTIVYSGDKELNIMSKYSHKIQLWVGGLVKLIPLYKGSNSEFAYLSEQWDSIGKDVIKLKDMSSIVSKMNIKHSTKSILKILERNQFSRPGMKSTSGEYVIEDFIDLIYSMRLPETMENIFKQYGNIETGIISDKQVYEFLINEQKESISITNIKSMLDEFRTSPEDTFLTLEGFIQFLSSDINHIFNPYMKTIYQNMDRPITDYFIFSSHNTYLEGNQLSGWSSSDMYIRVLKAGCRCVELDCWNGDNGEPIIFHGHTLTSRILFEDAVRAIRDYAFVSSDYPVILSLENHCNVEQQTRMAEIMLQYLKDNIALPIVDSDKYYLPSPNELKGKILIKGKVDNININGYNSEEPEIKVRVAPELAAITYLTSTSFSNFDQFKDPSNKCWKICSFVETKLESLPPHEFIQYNKRNFSRIYPKGSRTMSSNYNPEPFWNGGSQLVALNLQTMGKVAWTNEGKFKDNGGCGYILKPYYMLHDYNELFYENTFTPPNPIQLNITILSARQIPTSRRQKGELVNPSITVSIRGFKCDTKSLSTGKIKGNTFNPEWNKELSFDILYPENAVLLFLVYNETDSLKTMLTNSVSGKIKIAYYSLPVNCIKQGYRIMELYNEDGNKSPMADLFCKIHIEQLNPNNITYSRPKRRDSFFGVKSF